MEELISVIVPIYNVEKFLERCICSLVYQSYRYLEIILVNDGSTDSCGQICNDWEKRDSRIKVIHKLNGGLSSARNAGIKVATGKYLSFVDSDDWLALDYYEILYNYALKFDVEIVASGVVCTYKDNREVFYGKNMKTGIYSTEEALRTIQDNSGFLAVAWNKLYDRRLFDDIFYPLGVIHEDEFVTYRVMAKAKRLALCQDAKYFYFQREDSIMSNLDARKERVVLNAFKDRSEFYEKNFPKLYVRDKYLFCMCCYRIYCLAKKQNESSVLEEIRKERKKITFSKKELKQFSLREIIYIFGTLWNIQLFCSILQWRH